jgi:hypothetical protein
VAQVYPTAVVEIGAELDSDVGASSAVLQVIPPYVFEFELNTCQALARLGIEASAPPRFSVSSNSPSGPGAGSVSSQS